MTDIEKRLEQNAKANEALENIKSTEALTKEEFAQNLKTYLFHKLELAELPVGSRMVHHMIGEKLVKSMNIDLNLLLERDVPSGCTSATAIINQKILLYIALQNSLGFEFPQGSTALIGTVDELIDAIWQELKKV